MAKPPPVHSSIGREKMARVMHEYKAKELRSSSGQKVTNPQQAIAIGLSEARKVEGEQPFIKRTFLGRARPRPILGRR